jgi:hypothetical protein
VINITVPEGEGTMDEHLDGTVETKRRQFHVVMNKGQAVTWSEGDIGREVAKKIVNKFNENRARQNRKVV